MALVVGQTNNRLTLIRVLEKRGSTFVWLAACECGNETRVWARDFKSGHTKSCGCYRIEQTRAAKITHGMSETGEYRSWCHMRDRCYRPANKKFEYYGGRGITVCDRWQSFEAFFEDMGLRPTPYHSLDRIDMNGNYEPGNCRWANSFTQAQNRRNVVLVTVDGEHVAVAEAERLLGCGKGSITQRAKDRGDTHQQVADHFTVRRNALALATGRT